MRLGVVAVLAALAGLVVPDSGARAQETKLWVPEAVPSAPPAPAEGSAPAPEPDGWKLKLHLSGNTSFGQNKQVVGSVDGATFQVGLVLEGNADLKAGQHAWLNELAIHHQQTKSPALEVWQKSIDDLKLQTTYLYHLEAVPWVGPFARLKLDTVIFPSNVTKPEDYDVFEKDGPVTPVEHHTASARTQLADALNPMTLRESAGFFADPIASEPANLNLKLGAGVQELIVNSDTRALIKSDEVGKVEVDTLKSTVEAGAEFEAVFGGKQNKTLSYELLANLLYPFFISDDKGLTGIDRLNTDVHGKLSVKLTDWGSLDVTAGAKRQPLVAEQWQLSTGLMLSAGIDLI